MRYLCTPTTPNTALLSAQDNMDVYLKMHRMRVSVPLAPRKSFGPENLFQLYSPCPSFHKPCSASLFCSQPMRWCRMQQTWDPSRRPEGRELLARLETAIKSRIRYLIILILRVITRVYARLRQRVGAEVKANIPRRCSHSRRLWHSQRQRLLKGQSLQTYCSV